MQTFFFFKWPTFQICGIQRALVAFDMYYRNVREAGEEGSFWACAPVRQVDPGLEKAPFSP